MATGSYWRAVGRAVVFGGLGVLLLVTGNLVGVLPLVVGLAYGVIARLRRARR